MMECAKCGVPIENLRNFMNVDGRRIGICYPCRRKLDEEQKQAKSKYGSVFAYAKQKIKKQRGSSCEICSYPDSLELHHVIPISEGGSNSQDNLILLCNLCHYAAHGKKARK